MLTILNALTLGAAVAVNIGVYGLLPNVSAKAKAWTVAGMATWTLLILAGAASGLFTKGRIPVPPLIFFIAGIGLLTAWITVPGFKRALLSIRLDALVGLHAARILGVFFVLLWAAHQLAAPFGPIAGWGDMIAGADAAVLAIFIARGRVNRPMLAIWNAFGALDLFTALTLGALSSATPIQVFFDPAGISEMALVPTVLVPTMLVPLYLLNHLAVATHLVRGKAPSIRNLPEFA